MSESDRFEVARRSAKWAAEEADRLQRQRDACWKEAAQLRQERDDARKMLRVALGLLRVANFDTDFEGKRAYDLETKIEEVLIDAAQSSSQ